MKTQIDQALSNINIGNLKELYFSGVHLADTDRASVDIEFFTEKESKQVRIDSLDPSIIPPELVFLYEIIVEQKFI